MSEDLRDYLKGEDWNWIKEQERIIDRLKNVNKCPRCGKSKGKYHTCSKLMFTLKCGFCGRIVHYKWWQRFSRGKTIRKYCSRKCAACAGILMNGGKLSKENEELRNLYGKE